MPPKRNPLKLNKLQLRTLTLAQLLAQDPDLAQRDEATGAITLVKELKITQPLQYVNFRD